jgi:pseudouridylate synthase
MRSSRRMNVAFRWSPEVAEARAAGRAVVALESNVLAHGLPRPLNLDTAVEVEQAIRAHGQVPATVAIIAGQVVVGLSHSELEQVATASGVAKLSTRDIGACLARNQTGATTIAATMCLAHAAGLPIVASAGLGGVHRGVAQTMDISPDLMQLAHSQVIAVTAGAKSILDLPKTVEYLETLGVPVIGYRSSEFPAFYCSTSGIPCQMRIDDPTTLVSVAQRHWSLPGSGAVVATHPIRAADALDSYLVDSDLVESAIDTALAKAERDRVSGAGLTRYLMTAVDTATQGQASAANAAVLRSTASAAGEIAASWTNALAAVG